MLAGKGVMMSAGSWGASATAEDRQAWRQWHSHHMVGRLGVPGFLRGRRYGSAAGTLDKLTFYEMEAPGVLASPAYMALADEPFGTPEAGRSDSKNVRNIAHVKHSLGAGHAVGGYALTTRFDVAQGSEKRVTRYLIEEALPAVAGYGDVTGAHLLVGDADASAIVPASIQGKIVVGPRWIVMLEGMAPETLRAAFDTHIAPLNRQGAEAPIEPKLYALELVMTL